jgi:hypothetical protein
MTAPSYKQLGERWEKRQKAEREIYAKVAATKRPSGPEIVATLKEMHAASGDRRLAEAVNAIQEHGFDRADAGTWKRARAKVFGPTNETIVETMRRSLKHNPSVRHAAARAAVECGVNGKTFAAAERHCRDIWQREIERAEELEKSHPPKNT